MGDFLLGLRKDLGEVQALLDQTGLFSFTPEEREALAATSHGLLARLDSLGDHCLTAGLLGGTGVGKSTLMNALAGREITSAGHRRPHTDQVLIYRHEEVDLPASLGNAAVPHREFLHRADEVRQVILCDLPDFDSLVGAHRERVAAFLEHLDVVIWVSSPEKYADARFYLFLDHVPKAKRNYYFALNKADLFFKGQPAEKGYQELAAVMNRFQQLLTEHGVEQPALYAVSAHEAAPSGAASANESAPPGAASPWNQFPAFRRQIFQMRDAKEVMSIKGANLDVEIRRLLRGMEAEFHRMENLHRALRETAVELKAERMDWARSGSDIFTVHLEGRAAGLDLSRFTALSSLAGPGRMIASLLESRGTAAPGDVGTAGGGTSDSDEGPAARAFRNRFQGLKDRTAQKLLSAGVSVALIRDVEERFDAGREAEDLSHKMRLFSGMALKSGGDRPSAWFRRKQSWTYGLITLAFLFALAGGETWPNFIDRPSWSGLAKAVASIPIHIFSPAGLAALVSYLLTLSFFGVRFYAQHRRILERRRQAFIESLKVEFQRLWEEKLDSFVNRIGEYAREIEVRKQAMARLFETKRGE